MKIDERKIRGGNSGGRHNPDLQESAEALAVAALGFIAGDDERLERFLALSGLAHGNLRQAAAEPHFLHALLDYMCGDEALLLGFAAHQRCDPASIARARHLLSGEEHEMP